MFTVLHVEHNRFYHAIVKNLLAKDEIQYIPVRSRMEAMEILKSTKVNLIITGLIFQDASGEEFIKELCSSKYKNLPIIIFSSNDEEETIESLKLLGTVNYINKNTSLENLKTNVYKHISRNATYEELRKFKIAVLNSNELELLTVKKMFETNFLSEVHYYNNAESFIDSREEYNLYLINFALAKISGDHIVSAIRERNPKAVIISITAVDSEEIISNLLAAGANDYIKKPFSEDSFLSRIHINIKGYIFDESLEPKKNTAQTNKKLVGLMDKEAVCKRLFEEIKRVRRHKGKLSIVYLGIDKYDHLKISYGMKYINEVVKAISEIIKDHIRLTDIMGYFSEKEFLLILPSTDVLGGVTIAEKLRDIIEYTDFGREELTMTVSGGVAELTNEEAQELIAKASELMHQASFYGGNRVEHVIENENVY